MHAKIPPEFFVGIVPEVSRRNAIQILPVVIVPRNPPKISIRIASGISLEIPVNMPARTPIGVSS